MVLERVPWTARRSSQSTLKEINPEYSCEGLMLKPKLQYFGHLIKELTHWKRSWCWKRFSARGEEGHRGLDGWMTSLTQWTCSCGCAQMPGASMRNPAHGKGHEEGSLTKHKCVIQLQGFPLSFPEHLPPKTRVGLILLYCAFPLFWHSLEKVNLGLQSSAFERNVSAQTPSDGSLICLTGSPDFLQFVNCLQPPNCERHKA